MRDSDKNVGGLFRRSAVHLPDYFRMQGLVVVPARNRSMELIRMQYCVGKRLMNYVCVEKCISRD